MKALFKDLIISIIGLSVLEFFLFNIKGIVELRKGKRKKGFFI